MVIKDIENKENKLKVQIYTYATYQIFIHCYYGPRSRMVSVLTSRVQAALGVILFLKNKLTERS